MTAAELAEIAIARSETINPEINAIIEPLYEMGRRMANDHPQGSFAGVPFLIKDLGVHVQGTPLSNGIRGFQGQLSETDSIITRQFREAGLIFLGKTNTPELGLTSPSAQSSPPPSAVRIPSTNSPDSWNGLSPGLRRSRECRRIDGW